MLLLLMLSACDADSVKEYSKPDKPCIFHWEFAPFLNGEQWNLFRDSDGKLLGTVRHPDKTNLTWDVYRGRGSGAGEYKTAEAGKKYIEEDPQTKDWCKL